eukprot:GHVP01022942.1.p1 GENE.GHVP01022942.1~~GHVP01022942.1.p1  ORF type:complete len:116 (-),score=4.10 GHVP01022942.1:64-411(-)
MNYFPYGPEKHSNPSYTPSSIHLHLLRHLRKSTPPDQLDLAAIRQLQQSLPTAILQPPPPISIYSPSVHRLLTTRNSRHHLYLTRLNTTTSLLFHPSNTPPNSSTTEGEALSSLT